MGFFRTACHISGVWNRFGMATLKVASLFFLVGAGFDAVVLRVADGSSGSPPPSSCGTNGDP
eukprot:11154892-Lingulodinium_polyedra.AAC.1